MTKNKKIYIISNTHWDREWYMSLEKYRIRLVKMLDRLINIMEREPEYIFVTDGQYMMIEDYLAVRPQMKGRISELVRQDRLLIGPWYTQPLETLVSGEAMVRNLLYGIRQSEIMGKPMLFAYMVDEFGHASQTPQILKGFGITDVIAWRGIEHDAQPVFEWISPDGSSVIMHKSLGYGEATALPVKKENYSYVIEGQLFERKGLVNRINGLLEYKEHAGYSNVQFWLNGIDHSWAQEDILDVIEMINELYPDCSVRQSSPAKYAEEIKEYYRLNNIDLIKFKGELMSPDTEVLQSTHSCRADHKLEHYKAEHLIEKYAEPLSTLSWLLGDEFCDWGIDMAWKYILENHAHDSLGCCSVDSVYKQTMARYDSSISISEQLIENALAYMMSLKQGDNYIYIYYPNSTRHCGAVCSFVDIPDAQNIKHFKILDVNGQKVDYTIIKKEKLSSLRYNPQYGHPSILPSMRYHLLLDIPDSKGISFLFLKVVKCNEAINNSNFISYTFGVMENEYLHVAINSNGTINLIDKSTGRQYYNLLLLEDSGECGSFYLHKKPENNEIITNMPVNAKISMMYNTKLGSEYKIEYTVDIPVGLAAQNTARSQVTKPMDVRCLIRLLKGNRRLDVRLSITNRCDDHQLRVLFPTQLENPYSTSGQPFDIVKRSIKILERWNIDKNPSFTCHPMQDFCDASNDRHGLTVAAKGIYEYELMTDQQSTLALTLFRSVDCIDRLDEGVLSGFDTSLSKLHTNIEFEMAILPHGEHFDYGNVLDFANQPLILYKRSSDETFIENYTPPAEKDIFTVPFIEVSDEDVIITLLKKGQKSGSMIIRLLNLSDSIKQVTVNVSSALGDFKKVSRLNLNEDLVGEVSSKNRFELEIKSKEIVTLQFEK